VPVDALRLDGAQLLQPVVKDDRVASRYLFAFGDDELQAETLLPFEQTDGIEGGAPRKIPQPMLQVGLLQALGFLCERFRGRELLELPDRVLGGMAQGLAVHLARDAVLADEVVLEAGTVDKEVGDDHAPFLDASIPVDDFGDPCLDGDEVLEGLAVFLPARVGLTQQRFEVARRLAVREHRRC
jgi:hypothetical protein